MERNTSTYIVLILLCGLCISHGFLPNKKRSNPYSSNSVSHKKMTNKAIRRMAVIFMNDFPKFYPDQNAAMSTKDFKGAMKNFRKAVAKPDVQPSLANNDPAHFNSEKIVQSNERMLSQRTKIINAIIGDDMTGARDAAGQLFHTLQDFYSHTNWVEMGNEGVNAALGKPGSQHEIGRAATIDEPTCTDCGNVYETCEFNIRHEINAERILTSGYLKTRGSGAVDPADFKPLGKGKCSHGGVSDQTVNMSATGGINKDSRSAKFSPHHYLHKQAANQAEEATLEYLKSLRESTSDGDFAKFIGLAFGSSLCFIIDTTGSMGEEIAAVREFTINKTRDSAGGLDSPSDYVLSPFNDPSFGPVFKTTDPLAMISALSDLTATGGGDLPEMFMSGTILALQNVRPGSTCFAFTDAPAKDHERMTEASALVVANQVTIFVFYSGSSSRRRRDVNQRSRLSPGLRLTPSYYSDLAQASGGQVIPVGKSDIKEVVNVVDALVNPSQITVLQKDNIVSSSAPHDVPVDETLTSVVISVTSTSGAGLTVTIRNPSGDQQVPGSPGSGATVILDTDAPTAKLYTVATPAEGVWTVTITGSGQITLLVTAESTVDFTYEFVESLDYGHGGYRPIDGKPTLGEDSVVVVSTVGGLDPVTEGPLPVGMAEVTAFVLVSVSGEELQRYVPHELSELQEYEVQVTLPNQGFRTVLEGKDRKNNKIQRYNSGVVTSAKTSVKVSLGEEGDFTATPGEFINVNITITNYGTVQRYTVTVSDSEGFFQTVDNSAPQVNQNETATVVANFKVPNNVTLGAVSTVTATASTSAGDVNFAVFRLASVSAETDETAPICEITQVDAIGYCTFSDARSCASSQWEVEFTAQDAGLGLNVIKAAEVHSEAKMHIDDFSRGTNLPVTGNYTSDCCHLSLEILATDIVGNTGRCRIQLNVASSLVNLKITSLVSAFVLLYAIVL